MGETSSNDEEKANWHPGEENRMTEGEAHNEANAVRAKIDAKLGRSSTKEDYDEAFRTIDELKQAAASEPDFNKIANKILRGANTVTQHILTAIGVIGTFGTINSEQSFAVRDENIRNRFQDAEKTLRDVIKQGEGVGMRETIYGKTTQELKKPKVA